MHSATPAVRYVQTFTVNNVAGYTRPYTTIPEHKYILEFAHLWGPNPPGSSESLDATPGDFFFSVSPKINRIFILALNGAWVEWYGLHLLKATWVRHPELSGVVAWIDERDATWVTMSEFLKRCRRLESTDASGGGTPMPAFLTAHACVSSHLRAKPADDPVRQLQGPFEAEEASLEIDLDSRSTSDHEMGDVSAEERSQSSDDEELGDAESFQPTLPQVTEKTLISFSSSLSALTQTPCPRSDHEMDDLNPKEKSQSPEGEPEEEASDASASQESRSGTPKQTATPPRSVSLSRPPSALTDSEKPCTTSDHEMDEVISEIQSQSSEGVQVEEAPDASSSQVLRDHTPEETENASRSRSSSLSSTLDHEMEGPISGREQEGGSSSYDTNSPTDALSRGDEAPKDTESIPRFSSSLSALTASPLRHAPFHVAGFSESDGRRSRCWSITPDRNLHNTENTYLREPQSAIDSINEMSNRNSARQSSPGGLTEEPTFAPSQASVLPLVPVKICNTDEPPPTPVADAGKPIAFRSGIFTFVATEKCLKSVEINEIEASPRTSASAQYTLEFSHFWGLLLPMGMEAEECKPGDFFFVVSPTAVAHSIFIRFHTWVEWPGFDSANPQLLRHPERPGAVAWIDTVEATWVPEAEFRLRQKAFQDLMHGHYTFVTAHRCVEMLWSVTTEKLSAGFVTRVEERAYHLLKVEFDKAQSKNLELEAEVLKLKDELSTKRLREQPPHVQAALQVLKDRPSPTTATKISKVLSTGCQTNTSCDRISRATSPMTFIFTSPSPLSLDPCVNTQTTLAPEAAPAKDHLINALHPIQGLETGIGFANSADPSLHSEEEVISAAEHETSFSPIYPIAIDAETSQPVPVLHQSTEMNLDHSEEPPSFEFQASTAAGAVAYIGQELTDNVPVVEHAVPSRTIYSRDPAAADMEARQSVPTLPHPTDMDLDHSENPPSAELQASVAAGDAAYVGQELTDDLAAVQYRTSSTAIHSVDPAAADIKTHQSVPTLPQSTEMDLDHSDDPPSAELQAGTTADDDAHIGQELTDNVLVAEREALFSAIHSVNPAAAGIEARQSVPTLPQLTEMDLDHSEDPPSAELQAGMAAGDAAYVGPELTDDLAAVEYRTSSTAIHSVDPATADIEAHQSVSTLPQLAEMDVDHSEDPPSAELQAGMAASDAAGVGQELTDNVLVAEYEAPSSAIHSVNPAAADIEARQSVSTLPQLAEMDVDHSEDPPSAELQAGMAASDAAGVGQELTDNVLVAEYEAPSSAIHSVEPAAADIEARQPDPDLLQSTATERDHSEEPPSADPEVTMAADAAVSLRPKTADKSELCDHEASVQAPSKVLARAPLFLADVRRRLRLISNLVTRGLHSGHRLPWCSKLEEMRL
ncbi:hypothetical protein DXG01_005967 [Tephrocybe rancida]|nr:hypothetical protein DXG01_005967 [Tephrocybe rancida]